jgi:hypothetical protein
VIAAPKAGTDAHRVLSLVVANPGRLDAEAIGQRLWKPALTSTSEYLRVRAAIVSSTPAWSRRASGILRRLTEAGLVEHQRGPRLSEDVPMPPTLPCHSMHKAAAWAISVLPNGASVNELRILADLVRLTPDSVGAWVGHAPNGATQRAVSALYEAGIVVPPSFRWPTAAGVALIEGAE